MNKTLLIVGGFVFVLGYLLATAPLIPSVDFSHELFVIVPMMNAAADIGGILFIIVGFLSVIVGLKMKKNE